MPCRPPGAARADVAGPGGGAALGRRSISRRTIIRAPISGRIGRSVSTTGALVQAGAGKCADHDPAARPDLRRHPAVERRPAAPARANARRPGRERHARRSGCSSRPARRIPMVGTLSFADVTVDPATGSQTIRAVFPNPQRLLLPGMFVRGQLGPGRPDPRHPGAAARGQPRRARPPDGAGRRARRTCPSSGSSRPTAPSATIGS